MLELDSPQALEYVAARLNVPVDSLRLTALGGGVSNLVYLAEAPGVRCVLKQALAKLRVEADWYCTRDRIHRECDAIRALGELLPQGAVPALYFEDQDNHVACMEAAAVEASSWKQLLLDGTVRETTGARVGLLHGTWLRSGAEHTGLQSTFSALSVFDDLRLAPYYRTTAQRHPDLAPHFDRLIDGCLTRRVALVHGDLSPKNFLIGPDAGEDEQVMLIDFEVAHWGDPSFDMAFLLNHFLLKSFVRPQFAERYLALAVAYRASLVTAAGAEFSWMETAAMRHLAGLLLARIDGKSPAEYIHDNELKERVRAAARRLFAAQPERVEDAYREALQ